MWILSIIHEETRRNKEVAEKPHTALQIYDNNGDPIYVKDCKASCRNVWMLAVLASRRDRELISAFPLLFVSDIQLRQVICYIFPLVFLFLRSAKGEIVPLMGFYHINSPFLLYDRGT